MPDLSGIAVLLAQAAVILIAVVCWRMYRMLTRPPRRTAGHALAEGYPIDPSGLAMAYTDITLKDSQARPHPAWRVEGQQEDGPIAIVIHGWADSRYQSQAWLGPLVAVSRAVVLFDLPGHGDSPAGPCTWGPSEIDWTCAVVEQVRRREPGQRVMLLGYSMGGLIAIAAGSRCAVDGVVADSVFDDPFTTICRSLRRRRLPRRPMTTPVFAWMKWRLPMLRTLRAAEEAAKLTCPLLVLHAELDHLVTADESRAIAEAAPRGQWVSWPGAGHNEPVRLDATAYQQRLQSFVANF